MTNSRGGVVDVDARRIVDARPSTGAAVLRIVTRLNIGGPARQALLLTRALQPDYATTLVTGTPPEVEGELQDDRVAVTRVPLVRPVQPRTDLAALAQVRRLVRSSSAQLIHTHMAKAGVVGRLAGLTSGRSPVLVHTFHGHVLEGYFGATTQRAFIDVERRLAKRTHALVAVSPQIRDDLLALGIGTPDRWHVIPLGLELDPFLAVERPAGTLRAALGLSARTPLIGAVGRLVPIKDLGTLITAVAALPGVHLALVGDGEDREALEARAAELGVGDRVHVVGWWPDIPGAMSDLDVVALSSRNEGTPVALIEALCAGRPVVATDVGGVAHVLGHGERGTLVPPADPEALSRALSATLDGHGRATARAAVARAEVGATFGSARLVADVRALYDDLLGRARPVPAPPAALDLTAPPAALDLTAPHDALDLNRTARHDALPGPTRGTP